ncbi:MAG: response regulator [Bacteroidia bacterium]|nr:response regulator [Bacteroidia bacterium]MBT8310604.1 response regulator [Bacteroidia bacterium]NND10459.1 response regulator [Flavobacteriaceae bacterium]NNL61372.1 response regulator [Flavobacteriaceae bacterium]
MSRIIYITIAISLLFSPISIAQNATDIEGIKNTINETIILADLDAKRGNYYIAETNLLDVLKKAEDIQEHRTMGIIYIKLAKLKYALEEPDKALSFLAKAAEKQRITNDNVNLAETFNTYGLVYANKKKDYEAAIGRYEMAKKYAEDEGIDAFIPIVILNKALAHIELKEFKTANDLLEKSIVLAKNHKLNETLSSALINNSQTLLELNRPEKAISQAQEGLKISEEKGYSYTKSQGYLIMSKIYDKIDQPKKAYEYLEKHLHITDSILEIKRENLEADDGARLNTDEDLSAVNKQHAEELKKLQEANELSRLTTILSIALITILSLLTLSLYKNNNIRLKTNNMLHKKNDELIKAKEKAELASRTKANFLSTVTHELRTPLYAVTGLTNMLLDEDPKPEQVQHLKSLRFSGDYLLTFINDILQINKIEANKVEIEPELFNLKTKIENVISALTNQANDNNIKIHFEFDKGLPENYNADQLKISQILINLIGNSIKFTKDGDIWVRVYKIDEQDGLYNIRFEVEDNGIGITKEKQEHMFESFSQGSIQINRKYGGTGLGLSIVKGLMDILKGKIYLTSELGKGTTFYFELPLEHSTEVIKSQKTEYFKDVSELELSNIKILVVEDNKINQMITKKILNKMGLNCEVVDNGESAVEKVKSVDYDVVLMDIHMPGISGLEATKRIRSFNKELTIFALTAVTIEDKMHEFDEAGFDDIISKPFKQVDFEKKLYNALIGDKANAS